MIVYHILPEAEAFSEHNGGALSRWAANVLRTDGDARVVCSRADATWAFDRERVIVIRAWSWYHRALVAARGHIPWKWRDVAARLIFASFARRLRPGDIVYIHNRPELVDVFRSMTATRDVRIVLHMHNSHLVTYPAKVTKRADPDLVVFCSRFLEKEARLQRPDLRATVVLHNGADQNLFFPHIPKQSDPDVGVPIVLFVGRLVPEKGVHVFIDALKRLEERSIHVRGCIVGSAEFGSQTRSTYVRSLQASAPANVSFSPYASGEALAQTFRSATIFCCPSIWNEAFGMVNVEAMASRLPVVATRVGGIAEIFANGGALLVSPNSVDELADAIAKLVEDPTLRAQMAEAGYRVFIERFEWSVIRKRYREVIDRVFPDSSRDSISA